VHSCNHCCSGRAISITYSKCVFVALVIQHAMHMHHSSVACLKKKLLNIKCVLIFSTTLKHFSLQDMSEIWSKIYIGFHVKYLLYLSDIYETWNCWQILKKYWNIKFHENLSSSSRVVPCGQTDMMKLLVAFQNYANVPINWP
jgi:hypothetical protein